MIDRFKGCVCCVLILIIQFALTPVGSSTAATKQIADTNRKQTPAKESSLKSNSSSQSINSVPPILRVSVNATPEVVSSGEIASFDLTVANTSTLIAAPDVRLMNLIPTGFKLNKGSVLLNGTSASAPTISADGRALTFIVGTIAPGASVTIHFETELPDNSPAAKAVNIASAFSSGAGTSNIAKATVSIKEKQQQLISKANPAILPETLQTTTAANSPAATAPPADTAVPGLKKTEIAAPSPASPPQTAPPELPAPNKLQSDNHTADDLVVPERRKPPESVGIPDIAVAKKAEGRQTLTVPGATLLQVTINADREKVAPGETVNFDLTVTNTSTLQTANDVRLMDLVPAGFRLKKGSVQLNNSSISDPVFSADGRALTFVVGNLAPGTSVKLSFETEIAVGSPPNKAVVVASAFSGGRGTSNIAKATVTVEDKQQKTETAANTTAAVPLETLHPPVEVKAAEVIPPAAATNQTATPAAVFQAAAPPPVLSPQLAAPAKEVETHADAVVAKTAAPESPLPEPLTAPTSVAKPPAVNTEASAAPPALPELTDNKNSLPVDDSSNSDLVVQKTLSLAELIGMTDISVLSDADGQFVKIMAENQTMDKEFASKVDETNLLESIRIGRSFNRESRAALARTEQANAQTGQALALLLPSVSVRANYGSETSAPSVAIGDDLKPISPDTHTRTDAALTVRQPLFDLPSFMDWRRRKVVEQTRGENYRVSDGDAYIASVTAYLAIVATRLQTDMTREFETRLNDLLVYIEKRAKAGAASHSDMSRVRARSQATLSSRLEQESAHAAAGIEFIRLTNIVPRKVRLPALDDIGAALLPKSLESAVTTSMKANPEITALATEIQAADIDTQVAKGRYLPRIDAEYTNSYSLHAGGNTSSAGQKDQRLMMVLNWSLFSGGGDYKSQVERTSRYKELQYRLDDQRRRVVQSLSANYATLTTTRERITSGYQELKAISTASEAMSKRMLSGNQSLLDMLDVYDRLYQVRSRLVSLHILELSTAAQLVRLTQGTPGAVSQAATSGLQSKN